MQDFTINFSSGLIPREDGVRLLQLIPAKQNGALPLDLGKGVVVPVYAIADHVNVDENYVGAVDGENRARLLKAIVKALQESSEIKFERALRHVPLSGDASPNSE